MSNFKFIIVTVAVLACALVCLLGPFYLPTSSWWSGKHRAQDEPPRLIRQRLVGYRAREWWMTIGLGTPPQSFGLAIDSGSRGLWIRSADCKTTHCSDHRQFNRGASTSYEPTGQSAEFQQKSVHIKGVFGKDKFQSYSSSDLKINEQEFLEATELSGQVLGQKLSDGVLGLAPSSGEFVGPFEWMVKQKLISRPVFSIFLQLDQTKAPDGEIIFGGWDDKYLNGGEITWAPLTSNTSWQVSIDEVGLVGPDGSIFSAGGNGFAARVDTGQAYLLGPKEQVDTLNGRLNATLHAGAYVIDCNPNGKPDLVFVIKGRQFRVEPRQYIVTYPPGASPSQLCCTAIMAAPAGDDFWTLGALFVGSHYTIFDVGSSRIGFADSQG